MGGSEGILNIQNARIPKTKLMTMMVSFFCFSAVLFMFMLSSARFCFLDSIIF